MARVRKPIWTKADINRNTPPDRPLLSSAMVEEIDWSKLPLPGRFGLNKKQREDLYNLLLQHGYPIKPKVCLKSKEIL